MHSVSWRDITGLGARLVKVEHEVHATLFALALSLLNEVILFDFFIFILYGHGKILEQRPLVLGDGINTLLLYLIIHFDDGCSKWLSFNPLQHSFLISFMLELITIV